MTQIKSLIVNADDFGIDEYINLGIADCLNNGIVRSVSVIPVGVAFDEALSLIKANSDVGVGIHLCLTGESPIMPQSQVRSIISENGSFFPDFYSLFYKIFTGSVNLLELRKELIAQVKKVLDSGITPTHIDSHQYIHLIPPVFDIVIELAKKFCIKWIRYPGMDCYAHITSAAAFIKETYLFFFSRPQLLLLQKNRIGYVKSSYGILTNGHLNEKILGKLIRNLNDGLSDITCHPGFDPRDGRYLLWKYSWRDEVNALTSNSISDLIKNANVKLINYAMLN